MYKKIFKKVISVFLVIAMLLPNISFEVFGFDERSVNISFSDISEHYAEDVILRWANNGFISGMPDGTFMPQNNVTRAEFIALMNRAFKLTATSYNRTEFKDVNISDWYYEAVNIADSLNLVSGYSNGNFGPNDPITREDACVIVSRYLSLTDIYDNSNNSYFIDKNNISEYAVSSVEAMNELKLVNGYPSGEFMPKNNITRADSVILLNNVYELTVGSGITGKTYTDGNTLGDATISVALKGDYKIIDTVKSDNNGLFNISLEAGEYDLIIYKDNLVTYESNVIVNDGYKTFIKPNTFEGVEVTGALKDINNKVLKNTNIYFKTNPYFNAISDADGKITLYLPKGRDFTYYYEKDNSLIEVGEFSTQKSKGLVALGDIKTTIGNRAASTGGGSDSESISDTKYTLTLNAESGGNIVIGESGSYRSGDEITIEAKVDDGYEFVSWYSSNNGTFINRTSVNTTFTMPANDTTVTAEFKKVEDVIENPTYNLILTSEFGGSIVVGQSGSYNSGDKIIFEAKAYEGYEFVSWSSSDNGVFSNSASINTTFTMPANDTTVIARFKEKENVISENDGYSITNINLTNDVADIEFSNNDNCNIEILILEDVVGQSQEWESGEEIAKIVKSIDTFQQVNSIQVDLGRDLPQYYIMSVKLTDNQGKSLSEPFIYLENTYSFILFDEKTIDDFKEELVINLDEQIDENFMVLNDKVNKILISQYEDIVSDMSYAELGIYKFTNYGNVFRGIESGDKIVIVDEKESYVHLINVENIYINGDTITIESSEDISLQYYFEYIDIEIYEEVTNFKVDMTGADDSVSLADNPNIRTSRSGINLGGVDLDVEVGDGVTFNIANKRIGDVEVSGDVNFNFKAIAEINYDVILFGEDYFYSKIVIKNTAKTTIKIESEGKTESEVNDYIYIGGISFPFGISGLAATGKLYTDIEGKVSVSAKIEPSITSEIGFIYSSKNGYTPINKNDIDCDLNIEIDGTIFVGPRGEFSIAFLDRILKASVEYRCGLEIKGVTELNAFEPANYIHECGVCIDGSADVLSRLSLKMSYCVVGDPKVAINIKINETRWALSDFYLSVANNEQSLFGGHLFFGNGDCINVRYRVDFDVTAEDGREINPKPVIKIDGKLDNGSYSLPEDFSLDLEYDEDKHSYHTYLYNGTYIATVSADGYLSKWVEFEVNSVKKEIKIVVRDKALGLEKGQNGNEFISAGFFHTVGLKNDGTVVAVGRNNFGECNVEAWSDIVAISAAYEYTVGLKSDGTVVMVGHNNNDQADSENWIDIIAVSTSPHHVVGLKSDGTVVAVGGSNSFGQHNVEGWSGIIAVSAGTGYTVGLKSDGTVVAVGKNDYGQCNVEDWTDIVEISAGPNHVVGLKSDGTVMATGSNQNDRANVGNWNDVVSVSAGSNYTVGLKSNGTVITVGDNAAGQCDVADWSDIVAISASYNHTVGLKSDGTVVAVGTTDSGRCNVDEWNNMYIPISINQTAPIQNIVTITSSSAISIGEIVEDNDTNNTKMEEMNETQKESDVVKLGNYLDYNIIDNEYVKKLSKRLKYDIAA